MASMVNKAGQIRLARCPGNDLGPERMDGENATAKPVRG